MVFDKVWKVVYRFNPGDTSGHQEVTMELPASTEGQQDRCVYLQGGWVGDIVISNMKIEIGDTATEWIPAKEDDEKIFELIASVTTTEEVNAVTMDGFDLKAFVLEMEIKPGATACNGWIQIRETATVSNLQCDVSSLRSADASGNPRYTRVMAERIGNVARISASKPSIASNGSSSPTYWGSFINPKRFGCVKVYLSNSELIPIGSKFELWGVRT